MDLASSRAPASLAASACARLRPHVLFSFLYSYRRSRNARTCTHRDRRKTQCVEECEGASACVCERARGRASMRVLGGAGAWTRSSCSSERVYARASDFACARACVSAPQAKRACRCNNMAQKGTT
eukprot:6152713-Pleurochrysis_carterae.AAC.1